MRAKMSEEGAGGLAAGGHCALSPPRPPSLRPSIPVPTQRSPKHTSNDRRAAHAEKFLSSRPRHALRSFAALRLNSCVIILWTASPSICSKTNTYVMRCLCVCDVDGDGHGLFSPLSPVSRMPSTSFSSCMSSLVTSAFLTHLALQLEFLVSVV